MERAENIVRDYLESRITLIAPELTVESVSLGKTADQINIAFALKNSAGYHKTFSTTLKEAELMASEHPVTWHLENQLRAAVRSFNEG